MNNDILQQYIEGNSTQQEKEDVAKWLDADEKHMQQFLLLRNIYDVTLWNKENCITEIADEKHFTRNKRTYKITKRIIREVFKIAAVFLLALGFYHLLLSPKSHIADLNVGLQTVYAPEGQRAEVVLSDGTRVWLNAKSSLIVPNQFTGNERIVELTGEAYFDVTHDETKRFVVKTDAYQIKVYGTEFNVNAYKDSPVFETALIDGSVEVVSNSTNESIFLQPNTWVYAENNKLVLANIDNHDQFLWKRGILFFENCQVEDIFKKLELYYDVNIEVKNKKVLTERFTGKFWISDGVEHVLEVLQLRRNFKYTKDEINNIIIY